MICCFSSLINVGVYTRESCQNSQLSVSSVLSATMFLKYVFNYNIFYFLHAIYIYST